MGTLCVAAAVYTFLVPSIYEARTALLLPMSDASDKSIPFLPVGGPDPLAVLKGVLESRTATDAMSIRVGIDRKKVERMLKINPDTAINQLIVTAHDQDRDLALRLTQAAVKTLDELNKKMGFSLASRQADILHQEVVRRRADLKAAEDALPALQRRLKTAPDPTAPDVGQSYVRRVQTLTYQLDDVRKQIDTAHGLAREKARPAIELPTGLPEIQALRDKLNGAEYDLRVGEAKFAKGSPQLDELRIRFEKAQGLVRQEVLKRAQAIQSNVDVNMVNLQAKEILLAWELDYARTQASRAPNEAIDLQRAIRDIKEKDTVLQRVVDQFEKSQIEADVARVRWSVLETPFLQEKPVNKSYAVNVGAAAVIGLIIGMMLAIKKGNST